MSITRSAPILVGEPNCRDLGGLPASTGNLVRPGLLFRSSELARVDDRDLSVLQELGVRTIVDLRTEVERSAKPNRVLERAIEIHLPLMADLGAANLDELFVSVLEGERSAEEYMLSIYRNLDAFRLGQWKSFFGLLQGEPLLWHCTAGKDRTGMTAVLVLEALGVERSAIWADYLRTNQDSQVHVGRLMDGFAQRFGIEKAARLRDLFVVKESYLEAFYGSIASQWESPQGLLVDLGVDCERLRGIYLE